MPKALLLDAGNTLVFLDTEAIAQLLAHSGIIVAQSKLDQARKAANQHYASQLHAGGQHEDAWTAFMDRLLRSAALESAQIEQALPVLRTAHERFNLWRKVTPGAPAAIARLRALGIPVGVVSNSEGKLAELFDRVGLGDAFDLVVDSALEGVRKPDPEIFGRAAERLGLPPKACLYAGDIPEVDINGATAAGMPAVLIDPFELYPDYRLAPRCPSVVALIEALLAKPARG